MALLDALLMDLVVVAFIADGVPIPNSGSNIVADTSFPIVNVHTGQAKQLELKRYNALRSFSDLENMLDQNVKRFVEKRDISHRLTNFPAANDQVWKDRTSFMKKHAHKKHASFRDDEGNDATLKNAPDNFIRIPESPGYSHISLVGTANVQRYANQEDNVPQAIKKNDNKKVDKYKFKLMQSVNRTETLVNNKAVVTRKREAVVRKQTKDNVARKQSVTQTQMENVDKNNYYGKPRKQEKLDTKRFRTIAYSLTATKQQEGSFFSNSKKFLGKRQPSTMTAKLINTYSPKLRSTTTPTVTNMSFSTNESTATNTIPSTSLIIPHTEITTTTSTPPLSATTQTTKIEPNTTHLSSINKSEKSVTNKTITSTTTTVNTSTSITQDKSVNIPNNSISVSGQHTQTSRDHQVRTKQHAPSTLNKSRTNHHERSTVDKVRRNRLVPSSDNKVRKNHHVQKRVERVTENGNVPSTGTDKKEKTNNRGTSIGNKMRKNHPVSNTYENLDTNHLVIILSPEETINSDTAVLSESRLSRTIASPLDGHIEITANGDKAEHLTNIVNKNQALFNRHEFLSSQGNTQEHQKASHKKTGIVFNDLNDFYNHLTSSGKKRKAHTAGLHKTSRTKQAIHSNDWDFVLSLLQKSSWKGYKHRKAPFSQTSGKEFEINSGENNDISSEEITITGSKSYHPKRHSFIPFTRRQ